MSKKYSPAPPPPSTQSIDPKAITRCFEAHIRLGELRRLSAKMAEDDGLWFVAHTAPEAYLQQELRRLCAMIEAALPCEAFAKADALDRRA